MNMERWVAQAVCSQTSAEAFFPKLGESARLAKQVCISCPVRKECLQYALENNMNAGVWGGFTARERIEMRRGAVSLDSEPRMPVNPASRLATRYLLKCQHCSSMFMGQSTGRYCSDECRLEGKRKRQRRYHKRSREQAS